MKKLLFFGIALMFLSSCKQEPGTINGVVTYFFNKYQGYKPDIGAKVYVTKDNCDSINAYLTAVSAKRNIEDYNELIQSLKDLGEDWKYLEETLTIFQTEFNEYAKDSIEFKKKEDLAWTLKSNAIKNSIGMTTVDGVGNFTIDVPPGKYNVIFISSGRSNSNALELTGSVKIESVTVKSKEKSNIDAKFELR